MHLAIGELHVHVVGVDQRRGHQRTGRAGLHAFPQATQVDVLHRVVEVEHDRLVAAAGHADDVVDLHLAAGANAQVAMDARIKIDRHRGVAAVRAGAGAPWNRLPTTFWPAAVFQKPDCGSRAWSFAGWSDMSSSTTIRRAVLARSVWVLTHAGRGYANAARREHPLAFDLHHGRDSCRPAGNPAWAKRHVRQLDPDAARGTEDGLAGPDVDLALVDDESLRFVAGVDTIQSPGRYSAHLAPCRNSDGSRHDQLLNGFPNSSGKYFMTQRSGLGRLP